MGHIKTEIHMTNGSITHERTDDAVFVICAHLFWLCLFFRSFRFSLSRFFFSLATQSVVGWNLLPLASLTKCINNKLLSTTKNEAIVQGALLRHLFIWFSRFIFLVVFFFFCFAIIVCSLLSKWCAYLSVFSLHRPPHASPGDVA